MSELIKIGDLSDRCGVSTRTLRYYDGDIIGLYQGSLKNNGFHRYSPIFLPLKGNLSSDER